MPLSKNLGRQAQGRDDDYYNSPNMDPRIGRTPSPGHPLNHGYQLEEAPPYSRMGGSPGPGRLDIPMGPGRHTPSDRLQAQPTVSPPHTLACFRWVGAERILLIWESAVLGGEHQQLLRTQREL
jgi:hypothetical protein